MYRTSEARAIVSARNNLAKEGTKTDAQKKERGKNAFGPFSSRVVALSRTNSLVLFCRFPCVVAQPKSRCMLTMVAVSQLASRQRAARVRSCGFECVFEDTRSGNLPIFAHLRSGICGHQWNVQTNKNFALKRILSCAFSKSFPKGLNHITKFGHVPAALYGPSLRLPLSTQIAEWNTSPDHKIPASVDQCQPLPKSGWRAIDWCEVSDHMSGWEWAWPLSKNRYVLPASSPTHWLHDEPVHKAGHLFVSRSVAKPRAPSSPLKRVVVQITIL